MKPWELLTDIWQLIQGAVEEATPELEALRLFPRAFFLLSKVEEFPFPAQLAQALLLPAPTITFIVKHLEDEKFLTRELDRSDLRRCRLTLTDLGREVFAKGKEAVDRSMKRRMGKLSKGELKDLSFLLSRLRDQSVSEVGKEMS